jgi:hypothetical protein
MQNTKEFVVVFGIGVDCGSVVLKIPRASISDAELDALTKECLTHRFFDGEYQRDVTGIIGRIDRAFKSVPMAHQNDTSLGYRINSSGWLLFVGTCVPIRRDQNESTCDVFAMYYD